MKRRPRLALGLILALAASPMTVRAAEPDFLSSADLKRLSLQQYWRLHLPLESGETVARLALVDDTLYALTSANRALSVHAATGVVRWSNLVADEGLTVRGPSHASRYVFFTTPGAVRVFDRQTGDLAAQPRPLRGVVIEVVSETATIGIGEEHGVRLGDELNVYRANEIGEKEGNALAKLRITSVQTRSSRGRLERIAASDQAKPGDKVEADVSLPLQEVKLPFAASCAAVADGERVYVGAANQRFYAIDMLTGVQQWQLLTPNTVSATPVLFKETLYVAGQDGLLTSCTKEEKAKNWVFQTEAPIFADPVVAATRVYVSSMDRSLYCLDRLSGRRIWRERFDTPLNTSPIIAGTSVYQLVPQQGLIVLAADSGKRVWTRPEGGQFLAHFGDDVYLLAKDGKSSVLRVAAANGRRKEAVAAPGAEFAIAGLKDQSIFLGSAMGELACLRPADAPRLRPEQLQEALRNNKKIETAAKIEAQTSKSTKKAEPEPPKPALFADDDGLASRSTAVPVGGHGVLPVGEKTATTTGAEKKPAAKAEEEAEGVEKEAKEGEEAEPAEAATTQKAEEGEEPEAEEAADKGDEEKADENDDEDKAEDKKEGDEKEEKEPDEEKPEEGGDKEEGGG